MNVRTAVGTLLVCLAPVQAAAQDWDPPRQSRGDGVHIRVGRSYHLPPNGVAPRPVIVIGGKALIEGRVEDDVLVIGGPVEIGPTAIVRANIVAVGGGVTLADGAQVSGEIHDVGLMWPDVRFAFREWFWNVDRGWWAAFSLLATLFRFVLTLIAACLVALIAPRWVRRMQQGAADAPLAAGFVGLAGEVLAVPAFVIVIAGLVLTIVGIPLLLLVPFAVLALLVAWLAGYAAVAAQIGGGLGSRWRVAGADARAADVARGVTLLFAATFAGHLLAIGPESLSPLANAFSLGGFVIEFLAWTVGLGAALLAPLRRRWETGPPPLPSTPTPPSYGTANA